MNRVDPIDAGAAQKLLNGLEESLLAKANDVRALFGSIEGVVFSVLHRSHRDFEENKSEAAPDEIVGDDTLVTAHVTSVFLKTLRQAIGDDDAFASIVDDDPDRLRVLVFFDVDKVVLFTQDLDRVDVQ